MTMMKNGPLYNIGPSAGGGSSETQPNSGIVPVTHADLEYREPLLVKGDILDYYDVGERISLGGQGKVHRGREIATGKKVVIKRYGQEDGDTIKDWETILAAEEGAAREIGFLREANEAYVRNVPRLLAAGVTGGFEDPVAILEPIHGETLRELVLSGNYNPSKEEVKKVLDLLEHPLTFAHTYRSRPVVHRDTKPENVIVNRKGATLMDWGIARAKTGQTLIRTFLISDGFAAPELTKDDEETDFDPRTDIYGMGRIIQYMLLGDELYWASKAKPSRKDFQKLNISRGLVEVLEKATEEEMSDRFDTALEFYDAAVRAIDGNSLPARTESKRTQERKQEIVAAEATGENGLSDYLFGNFVMGPNSSNPGMKIIYRAQTGRVSLGGALFGDGRDLYERGKDVYEGLEMLEFTDEEKAQVMQYYFKNLSREIPDNSALSELASGKNPEQLYEEVKAGKPSLIGVAGGVLLSGIPRLLIESPSEVISEYKQAREEYKQKVGELEKVVSGAEGALGGVNENAGGYSGGLASGLIGSYLAFGNYLDSKEALLAVALIFGGAKLGSNTQRYFKGRKVKKKFREMGSWLPKPKSSKALEERAREGDVSLTDEEKFDSSKRAFKYALLLSCSIGLGTSFLLDSLLGHPYLTLSGGAISYLTTQLKTQSSLSNYFDKRKLKQKRLDAGLPAKVEKPEMQAYGSWEIYPECSEDLERILSEAGLKKRWFQKRFKGDGVEVKYTSSENSLYYTIRPELNGSSVTLHAINDDGARPIIEAIKANFTENPEYVVHPYVRSLKKTKPETRQPEQEPEVISGGGG